MSSDREHLQLMEKLFRDVIEHLKQRISQLGNTYNSDEIDLVEEEQTPIDQSTVTALRLEICLYSLCVDWARQQYTALEGVQEQTHQHTRENFFRLMATMAQAELARDNHARSFGLSSGQLHERPLTDAQMFTALESAAERQLATLIAA